MFFDKKVRNFKCFHYFTQIIFNGVFYYLQIIRIVTLIVNGQYPSIFLKLSYLSFKIKISDVPLKNL